MTQNKKIVEQVQDAVAMKSSENRGQKLPAAVTAQEKGKRGRKKKVIYKYFSCNNQQCGATLLVTFPNISLGESKTIKFDCDKCGAQYQLRASVKLVLKDK